MGHELVDDVFVVDGWLRPWFVKPIEKWMWSGLVTVVRARCRRGVVAVNALLDAIDVDDERRLVSVDDDEWPYGLALQLVGSLVICRIDIVADLNLAIAFSNVGVEVTLVTLLRFGEGLDDGGICNRSRAMNSRFFASGEPSLRVPRWATDVPGGRLRTDRFGMRRGMTSSKGASPVDRCGWLL